MQKIIPSMSTQARCEVGFVGFAKCPKKNGREDSAARESNSCESNVSGLGKRDSASAHWM